MTPVILLWLATSASALDLEAARANFDTVVRNYVAQRADEDDIWTLKRKTGKPLKLKYAGLEERTVHPAGGGSWRGLARFKTADGKSLYTAEVTASTGDDLWDVKSLRWPSKEQLYDLRSAFMARAAKAGKARPAGQRAMPEVTLADGGGKETFLPDCPKAKCLNVYVAPWCPACRKATGTIQALQAHLAGKGVPVRVIVGADEEGRCRDYAASFGDKALLDPEKRWQPGGVPHFTVSDENGGIVLDEGGAYTQFSPEEYASHLGL